MVCKEDVVSWFKELESYKRIDAMCTLLNMCLPFELRFIGTYLEELGKRDFQELRGAELRANNPTDLAADIGGANTDPRTRRKMALYVSLLRSCNFACATTLYKAMVSLEESGLLKGLYGDLLEEILLLYTMALHHPAFTFDQKSHFGEILEKLKVEDNRIQYQDHPEPISVTPVSGLTHSSITRNMSVPPPSLSNMGPPPGLMFVKSPGVPTSGNSSEVRDMGSPPVLSGPTGVLPIMGDVTHPPPGMPLPQYNMEYIGPHPWPGNIIVSPLNQPIEVISYGGGQSSSPGVSPGESRAASPRRRRASRDRSPPPELPDMPPPPPPLAHLAATFDGLTVQEISIRRIEEERLRELVMPRDVMGGPGGVGGVAGVGGVGGVGVQQLRGLEKLNGVRRVGGAGGAGGAPSSDSGSSAASSPPGTPAPPRRQPAPPPPPLPYMPYGRYAAPYPPPPAYRPPPPFANGEPHFPAAGAPYAPFVLYAPPKVSCWNCGGQGHAGHECKEPSMEEMTRAGGYQLDFGGPPEPDK